MALASNGIPIEFKQIIYYTIITLACLSMFRRTRRLILFVMRASWRLGFECGINYFLQYCYRDDWSDATLGRLLNGQRSEREPMSWGEMWYAMWGYKTKKQVLRNKNKDMGKEADVKIWRGLVVPDGERLLDEEDLRIAKIMRRRSWGVLEYTIPSATENSGFVSGHAGNDSRVSLSTALDNTESQGARTGQNITIGRKKKNKHRR